MTSVPPLPDLERCPGPEVLGAYAVGGLHPDEILAVSRHVDVCSACLMAMQSLDGSFDPLLSRIADPTPTDPFTDDECRRVLARVEALYGESAHTDDGLGSEPTVAGEFTGRLGPYEILGLLGHGGMGAVYQARHVHLGKVVALKVLPRRRSRAAAVDHFLREMKAAGRLNHPNIVQAHDAEVEGIPYLAMEFLEGSDLLKLVRRHGPLALADACEAIRQAALGLQHAHENGLVHRDIKPSNLMLTPQGIVKVLDLGLARFHAEQSPAAGHRPPTFVGTVDYMAPEQLRDSGAVDIRADLYGLGCSLFHLLAGSPPFSGPDRSDMQKQQAHLNEPPPPLRQRRPSAPHDLEVILDRLLAKDPTHRFATPAEVATALEPFAAGHNLRGLVAPPSITLPLAPPSVAAVPAAPPAPTRHPWVVPAAVFTATLVAGLALLWAARNLVGPGGRLAAPPLELSYFRSVDGKMVGPVPLVGAAAPGDGVRLTATLAQPAHCYLIAFTPDGRAELCHPPREDQAPPKTTAVAYPPAGGRHLDRGPGLYAFVLVASREPLPEYARWKSEYPWPAPRSEPGDAVWSFDGARFDTSDPAQAAAGPPPAFSDLCNYFRSRPGVEAVSAVAVPTVARVPPP